MLPTRQLRSPVMWVIAGVLLAAALLVPKTPALAADGAARISVDQAASGNAFYGDTTGISIEKGNLGRPSAMQSPTLANYLRTVSDNGVLRIGGNEVEQTFWTSNGEPAPDWAKYVVTPSDLRALKELIDRTGWKVVYGVNLRHYDPERAADEVAFASETLGSSLQGVEIGNEPNLYYTDTNAYLADFDAYVQAIKDRNPTVKIWGPTSAGGGCCQPPRLAIFLNAFVNHETSLAQPNIDALNSHRAGIAGCALTIPLMLSDERRRDAIGYTTPMVAAAKTLGVPTYLSETESSSGGGCPGVSDTYAAGLWTLDYTLTEAQYGERGIYFHNSLGLCDGPSEYFANYTSMCAPTEEDALAGKERARAPFYGLAALNQVTPGTFLQVDNPEQGTIRAYAIRADETHLSLVLINVTDPSTTGNSDVVVDLGKRYEAARSMTLRTDSPEGLAATTDVTLGGGVVQPNGVLTGARPTPVALDGNELHVSLAPGSAQIFSINA